MRQHDSKRTGLTNRNEQLEARKGDLELRRGARAGRLKHRGTEQVRETASRRSCTRGAASVEAVIVLPLFVSLFVGIFWVRDRQEAKLIADQEARRCAWTYSALGCDKDHIPDGCEVQDASLQLDGDLSIPYETVASSVNAMSSNRGDLGLGDFVKNLLLDKVVARLGDALTHNIEATKRLELERPSMFGGGQVVVSGKYRLACNLKSYTPDALLDEAWRKLMP